MIARAFPYDRPCRFQKFEATETILATGTTIWKPGFKGHEFVSESSPVIQSGQTANYNKIIAVFHCGI